MDSKLAITVLVVVLTPYLIDGQRFGHSKDSMSYSIVNGKVFMDPPTTTEPSFLEQYFPWLPSAYSSSNSEDEDEAIINSVSGPPVSESSYSSYVTGSSMSSYGQSPSYSQSPYAYQNSYDQNQSPYLTSEEDNYIPSSSINMPQQMMPDSQSGYNYVSGSQSTFNSMPQLPYPFSQLPGQATTERPFYQPLLDFFGYGSNSEEEELPLPNIPGLQSGQYSTFPMTQNAFKPTYPIAQNTYQNQPSNSMTYNTYKFPPPQFAQARSSDAANTRLIDAEGKYSADVGPKTDNLDTFDQKEEDENNPCPKLGFWRWNGDMCIAVGSVPLWACKPSDISMSRRVGVCRNKFFFPPGSDPFLGEK